MTQTSAAQGSAQAPETSIRPFQMDFPEEELIDLRRRINATRWPERETVADQSQGVPLATVLRQKKRIPNSFITTGSRKADTSQPGNSRSSSVMRYERRFDHSVKP